MNTTEAYTGTETWASCDDCDAYYQGPNALKMGMRHHQAKGHQVTAQRSRMYMYE